MARGCDLSRSVSGRSSAVSVNEFPTTSYRVKFAGGMDGVQLAGIIDRPKDWANEQASRIRPVAVFSHCFTCNKDLKATVRISRALAKSGIAVLRYDMTGLGGSEGEFSQTNFTTNLADVAAAIDFADGELGPVTTLIGHSFGGVASLVTAAVAGTPNSGLPLKHLSFVGTLAAPSDTHHLATLLSRMNPEIESNGRGEVSIGGINWTIDRQMLDDFRSHEITRVIPQIDCPVLLMHSHVDETVSFDHALRLMSLIQTSPDRQETSPRAVSLVSLAGADHLLATNSHDLTFVASLLASWCHRYAGRNSV